MPTVSITDLRTAAGEAALATAAAGLADGVAHLPLLERLRRQVTADVAAAALTQARLRTRATVKFGPDATRMFFTADGLEQASRVEVATHRFGRLAATGRTTVLDTGAGIGGDAIAAARSGLSVRAVERDPAAFAALAANVEVLGLTGLIHPVRGDALPLLADATEGAVFFDPARRADGRRIYDPELCSPALSAVVRAAEGRTVVAKVSPAIGHDDLPAGWEAEWVSTATESGRSVVEACLWSPDVATVPRRATVLPDTAGAAGSPDTEQPVGALGRYLYEPDGAVIRAGLIAEVVARTGGRLLHRAIAYVTADRGTSTPLASRFTVLEEVPFHWRDIAAAVRRLAPSDLTVKQRGVRGDSEAYRRELVRVLVDRSGPPLVLIRYRTDAGYHAVLARRS